MKKYDVVALGELLIDFTENGISGQGNPILEANPGGAPCNALAMDAKMGHKVAFVGKVGRDQFGDQLEAALLEQGIATEGLLRDEEVHTTLAFVHTKEDGDREFSFYRNPGADMMLSVENIESVKESMIDDCTIFHFGTLSMTHEGCREATKKAVGYAKEAGAIISFDPNLRESLWADLETAKEQAAWGAAHTDILKISDNEILWLTGEETYDAAVEAMKKTYPNIKLMLLSLGRDGSRAYMSDESVRVGGYKVATIETTGAGDCFCGSILHYVLENGWRDYSAAELTDMLTFANAAAAIVTTKKGALRMMPTKADVQKLIEEQK